MNVNQKIWLGFGSVLALVGVGSVIGFKNAREAERASEQLVREYFAEFAAAKTASEGVSMARIGEQRFVFTRNVEGVKTVAAQVEEIKSQMATIAKVTGTPARREAAASIAAGAGAYHAAFKRVEEMLVRRGLTQNQGLEGELRKAVHVVETKVKEQGQAELLVLMLMVRRHEKDFLLRSDAKYVDEIGKRIAEFDAQMKKLSLPPALQQELTGLWGTYSTAMKALASGDRDIKEQCDRLEQQGVAFEKQIDEFTAACAADIERAQGTTLATLATGKKSNLYIGIGSGCLGGLMALWIGLSLRELNRSIRRTADSIGGGVHELRGASSQFTTSSQTLASGSSEQASSLEETSASLEELASMTKRNAENAMQAKEHSAEARTAADAVASEMTEMKRAMADIKSSSDQISKIIKTIDEISFQTNILALNAAVEAARAGEAGMGFAVVADEVRNLAQRAAQSARETASRIEESVSRSEHGVQISTKVAASLDAIVSKAAQVDGIIAEIAQASQEQSQGISQITTAVAQMDKVTQSNAATAEESASAAEELNAQASSLQEAVGQLLALVGAVRHDEPAVREPGKSASPAKPVTGRVHGSARSFSPARAPGRLPAAAVAPEFLARN